LIKLMPSQQLPVAMRLISMDQQPILVEPPPPPLPSDANNGPEAVMCVIDAWLNYQDYLEGKQMSPQPHRSGTDNWHHPLPIDGERLLEQQLDICQCQNTSMKLIPQLEGQLDGKRALRKHFSWSQGFLKAHKPPICQSTPTS